MGLDLVITPLEKKLLALPPLRIVVQPFETSADTSRCRSGLVTWPMEAAYYGSLRCFPLTHRAGVALTRRNCHDLPSQIWFSPAYREALEAAEGNIAEHRTVSPALGEWLYGLPPGWTGLAELPQADAPEGRRHTVFDMFSGCAGLGLALHPSFRCEAYCEWDEHCRAVIKARIRDGHLDDAPIYGDIAEVRPGELPDFDLAALGFPCQDISTAGRQAGFAGERSVLFRMAMQIIRAKRPKWVLIENVAALRSSRMGGEWREILTSLSGSGYAVKWASVCAKHVGSPTTRQRVFFLGTRDGVSEPFPLPRFEADLASFNGQKPAAHTWLLQVTEESSAVSRRLKMLGNVVIPQQARLALDIVGEDGGEDGVLG